MGLAITVFDENKFDDIGVTQIPASDLISVVLTDTGNNTITQDLNVQIFFNKTRDFDNVECGFWDSILLDWSTDGCSLVSIEENGLYLCECNHATFFALIGNPTSVTQPLITVYVIAISLSIVFGSVVIVLMAKKVMSINRKVTVGRPSFFTMVATLFSTALYIIASLFMIIIVFVRYEEFTVSCTILVALEQFFLLAYFFWLMITVLMNYFTIAFELNNFDRWFKPLSVLSFVFPFLLTLIIFFIQFSPNATPFELTNGICWFTQDYNIGVIITPIVVICLINSVLILLIIRARRNEEYEFDNSGRMNLFTILTCCLFSGITWIGLPFTLFDETAQGTAYYLFVYFLTTTNALQGVFIFFHFVVVVRFLTKSSTGIRKPISLKKRFSDKTADIKDSRKIRSKPNSLRSNG